MIELYEENEFCTTIKVRSTGIANWRTETRNVNKITMFAAEIQQKLRNLENQLRMGFTYHDLPNYLDTHKIQKSN